LLRELGQIGILVNNAAHQKNFEATEDISAEEWDVTFQTNIYSMFYLCKAAIPHMKPGSAIVNTTSINAKNPTPHLLAYATSKGAIANFIAGLAAMVAEKGIRVNAVAPGPIWSPLIPSTMSEKAVINFGKDTLPRRAGYRCLAHHARMAVDAPRPSGLMVRLLLPPGVDDVDLASRVLEMGLSPIPLSPWYVEDKTASRGLLLGVPNLVGTEVETWCETLADLVSASLA
jgi:NAD(P)-dependent dehydrogenase (short-subunit alcohol dehydrogenase family)